MLRMVTWPAGNVPPGAFIDLAALDGRVVKTSVTRGEPILEGKLAPVGTKGGLSAVVAEGKRAMTVRVNDVVGVAGFALPGNYVDIMVNTQNEGSKRGDQDRAISKIVLERILVLAIAQESSRDETKPKVVNAVTLEVTPDAGREPRPRAQRRHAVAGAAQPGGPEARLHRRRHQGHDAQGRPGAASRAPKPVVVQARAAPRVADGRRGRSAEGTNCVEVIRGTVKSNECF